MAIGQHKIPFSGSLFPRSSWSVALLLVATCILSSGCTKEPQPLQLADLTPGERLFIARVVTLERAKAVALVDRPVGEALLDSLAAAWGDSSLALTLRGVPSEPRRSAAVSDLLTRILTAEEDSLLNSPRPDRLTAPIPDPIPEVQPNIQLEI
jgi:hypothetical protein